MAWACSQLSQNTRICGESHLNDTMHKPVHEALRQRITVHYNYAGLPNDEVSKHLPHKLKLAGASSSIIDPAALAAVHSFTQGNPRLIDNLMTDVLIIDSQQDRKTIDVETIRAAVDNQGFTDEVFKVQFTKSVTVVMDLFQKQEFCFSNKATIMYSCSAHSLRSPT